MAMTPAERQRRYRERLKAKAATGDQHAKNVIASDKEAQKLRNYKSHAKTYLSKYASKDELKEFEKIIQKRLD